MQKSIDQTLLKNFHDYNRAFWNEVRLNLDGILKDYVKNVIPDYYRRSGNLLIFPAINGLVGAHFERGFKFKDDQFNKWLSPCPEFSPFASEIHCDQSKIFSIAQWAQILSGNNLKIKQKGDTVPSDIYIDNFPQFPRITIEDPDTGAVSPWCAFVLEVEMENIGFSLRDVTFTEVDSGQAFKPFEWCQLDIFSIKALQEITSEKGRLNASREVLAILAANNLKMSKNEIGSEPTKSVVEKLKKLSAEYQTLLDQNPDEAALQSFLKLHPVLLCFDHLKCIAQPMLGSEYKMDFLLTRYSSDGEESLMVEIESPRHDLFTKSGDATAPLNHAYKQVRDWRAWLTNNSVYAKSSLKLDSLNSHSRAIIVIGRGNKMNNEQKSLLKAHKLERHETELLTYDDLIGRLEAVIKNLEIKY